MNYLIAGNGPAGVCAIEEIRKHDPLGSIRLVAKEPFSPYSRIMVPEYMTGEVQEEQLYFRGTNFYEKYGVEVYLGKPIQRVAFDDRCAHLEGGEVLSYDQLLLATGSRPVVPRWVDTHIRGVFTLWNKEDAETIRSYLPKVQRAVIIGGGLVGLQAARALHSLGIRVSILEMADYLLPAQLDPAAGAMLAEALAKQGVDVLLSTKVERLEAENGSIKEVITERASVPAELVLVATGVRPNLEYLEDHHLFKKQGMIVNEYLETQWPHVYAAGDIIQTEGRFSRVASVRALWLNAVQQGKIAGANMAGEKKRYQGSYALNSIELFGLPIMSLGETVGEGLGEQVLQNPSSGRYHKVFLRDGKLVGALMAGDIQGAGILFHKLNESIDLGYWGKQQIRDLEYMLG